MGHRQGMWPVALAGALLAIAVAETGPQAWASFRTGLDDGGFQSASAADRQALLNKAGRADAQVIRINLGWRSVTTGIPARPTDPADPAYDFTVYDAAISDAVAHGFAPVVTISSAPSFAEGPNRPASADPGTWDPDPAAFGAFAKAVAIRYSGHYMGLPRVRYFEAWNEPNLPVYLNPQWDGTRSVAAKHYRRMLNAFYGAIKAVSASSVVIAGATAPFGDPPNTGFGRTRPVKFLRELLCLNRNLKRSSCPTKPRFDVLSHHPINFPDGPRDSAANPDDASTPDLGRMVRPLRAAERAGTIGGATHHHHVWATEMWWESNPPDPTVKANLLTQARWIADALYLLWRDGAKVVVNLPLIDSPRLPGEDGGFIGSLQSGLFFVDGRQKPGFEAFRFPFVTERRSERKLFVWGRAPRSGALKIERKVGGEWRTVRTLRPRANQVFTTTVNVRGPAILRGTIGTEHSVPWRQRK